VYWEWTSVKSERPDLPLTIAVLVRSATRVTPLAAPSVRLARWAMASTPLALAAVMLLGPRADVLPQMADAWFAARATATLGIALAAASVAFCVSVPGVEPSRLMRALPLAGCLVWAAMLAGGIAVTPAPLARLLLVTPHPSCVLLIAAAALPPGVVLLSMLRRAAPLQLRRTARLAGLASFALGAVGAQFVCTNDGAAHHLLWHFTPVLLLTLGASVAGPSLLSSVGRRRPSG
jgi:hypothetical protein